MKKIYCFILSLGLFISANSQDVGLTSIVNPAPGQQIHLMFDYEIEFSITNFDNQTLPSGTKMTIDLLYNGFFYTTYNLTMDGALPSGDSAFVSLPAQTIAGPSLLDICLVVNMSSDQNKLNDTICETYDFSTNSDLDIGIDEIVIVTPNDTVFGTGSTINRMDVVVKNYGPVTIPRDYQIIFRYEMYTTNRTFGRKLNSHLDSGDVVTYTIPFAHPTIQEDPGSFQVCVRTDKAEDVNSTNDEDCNSYLVVDFTGTKDYEQTIDQLYFADGRLFLKLDHYETSTVNLNIYNLTGQLVTSKVLTTNDFVALNSIALNELKKGIYFVQLDDGLSSIQSRKILIE